MWVTPWVTPQPFEFPSKTYRKFEFVTQLLSADSIKFQNFVYHFVDNLKLLHEYVKDSIKVSLLSLIHI